MLASGFSRQPPLKQAIEYSSKDPGNQERAQNEQCIFNHDEGLPSIVITLQPALSWRKLHATFIKKGPRITR